MHESCPTMTGIDTIVITPLFIEFMNATAAVTDRQAYTTYHQTVNNMRERERERERKRERGEGKGERESTPALPLFHRGRR